MTTVRRYVYVARLKVGTEVELREVLRDLPREALAEAGFVEYTSYVGSGYCVLQFTLPEGDFQARAERFFNNPEVQAYHQRLAGLLVEGDQIAEALAIADPRFHPTSVPFGTPGTATTAELPLAAAASRWPHAPDAP